MESKERTHRSGAAVITAGLLLACALILASASTAFAGSAVCDQYPDLPQCDAPGGGGGEGEQPTGDGDDDTVGGNVPGAGEGPSGNAGNGGSLPFTGYPLSPLILFMLILLIAGLAVRGYLLARDRFVARAARPGS